MIHCPKQSVQLSTGAHTYCDVGDADRTLLLLHGFSFRPGLYPLAEYLQSDFRVVMPDLPFTTKAHAFRDHTLAHYVNFLFN